MGFFVFSINKSISWRGVDQGFGNRYIYELPTDEPSLTVLENMVDTLVNAEKPVHGSAVAFRVGRVWGPVGPNGRGGTMRVVRPLTASGTGGVSTSGWYKEFSFLCVWPLGRYGEKNRPQFLRKWIHPNTSLGLAQNYWDGSTQIPSPPGALGTYMTAVRTIPYGSGGPPLSLASPKGHFADAGGYVYPYLEHRQYG